MLRFSYAALALISIPIFSEASGARPQARCWSSRSSNSSSISTKNSSSTSAKNPSSASTKTTWTLTDNYQQWDFFNRPDPTNGQVNYLDATDAKQKHLAFVQGKSMILAVDNTTHLGAGENRNSVRISSKKTYNAGSLFIADFASMPASCGVWPAWWTVGPSWPNGGEIDVLENVHQNNNNKMTLHTSPGCVVKSKVRMSGTVDKTDCQIGKDNAGCGVLDHDETSYGLRFNQAGGGVYAHTWTNDAINVWHFSRDKIPADIKSNKPDPTEWGTPTGSFVAGSGCDFSQHFKDHVLTIDTTIGGDWGGSADGLKAAGCNQDLSKIVENPANFDSARWNINSIQVYNN
ncbi:glycoside hydrolase family 16 protein [Mycena vitilis]|nr:glycoside hydrolase family 16 protein [Mycena vitilis]